jgi:lipoate-protein ligase A
MRGSREKSQIISTQGPATDLHARPIPQTQRPQIWMHQVWTPTVVLGSTQNTELLDLEKLHRAGYDLVKRRSGGGLVVIDPQTSVWVDVVIPPSHELWSDDVGEAFMWVGQTWCRALARVGVTDLTVHRGPATNPTLGRLLCFGSVGSGEVVSGESKVVGLSQRRTRNGARFQGIAHQGWNHAEVAQLFAEEPPALDGVKIGALFNRRALITALVDELREALD